MSAFFPKAENRMKSYKITYVIPLFTPIRYLILMKMTQYFRSSNNVKYLVPS